MNVLSLFDGISCGQVALERANIKVDNYYASEIDKFAMQIAKKNYPNTIFLGDINKWEDWNIDWGKIDLLIGGSPCQGFSFAGKRLKFDDERSMLFFKYNDILNHIKSINPNIMFLLENVKMDKQSEDYITNLLGVKPIRINSNLVSAQNRDRLYWTNISKNIDLPKDKGIVLKDIIIEEMDDKYPLSLEHYNGFMKSYKSWKDSPIDGKSKPILATYYKQPPHCPYIKSKHSESGYRRLSPIECERLQTLPDNYTSGVSDTQRFKTIGNGWTIDIIAFIFSYIQKGIA